MCFLATSMEEDYVRLSRLLENVLLEVADLKRENALLKQEIIDLKLQLNTNSRNSSKPPSSDGYKKKPGIPREKKGKQGGQKGHKGKTLPQTDNPDVIVACVPSACKCGYHFTKEEFTLLEKRQVFELPPPKLEVTEYQVFQAICSCGIKSKGSTPECVKATVQYGNRAKAFTVLLNSHYKMPYKKIQLLFGDLFGYSINESTVYSASQYCFEQLEQTEQVIKSEVSKSQVVHADESGLRVLTKLHWLHTASTELYTYLFVHQKRGNEALMSEQSVLNNINGWLVHDCWSSYFKFKSLKHAICGAHILRELEGLKESPTSKWAKIFKQFLLKIYYQPLEERVKQRVQIESRYLLICHIGEKLEPPPKKTAGKTGRYKRTKGRNLVERLIREKEAILAFAFNEHVPFTNNLAERDIRPVKLKMKISNCFRTFKGAQMYTRIESFLSTTRKQNRNVFEELCNTFEGHNFLTTYQSAK